MNEAFYTPPPSMFGHGDAFGMFTTFAAQLEAAGLRPHFPADERVRHVAIELLVESYGVSVEDVVDDLSLIDRAVQEADAIVAAERG